MLKLYLALVIFTYPGKGPTKLMAQISKGRLRLNDIKIISSLFSGQPNLSHLSHLLTFDLQSLFNANHDNPSCMIFLAIVFAWKWPIVGPGCDSSIMVSLASSKEHILSTSSTPILYKHPIIHVLGVAFITSTFFFLLM